MAHNVSPETTVWVRGAGGGGGGGGGAGASAGGSGSSTAAGATSGDASGAAASPIVGGGGACGASSVLVPDAHATPSNPYTTTLRSSCTMSRTSLAPLVSVCQIGLSDV